MNHREFFTEKVLRELAITGQLRRSQLTVGPLRHISSDERSKLLEDLVKEGFLLLVHPDSTYGSRTSIYRITDKGRRFVKNGRKAA